MSQEKSLRGQAEANSLSETISIQNHANVKLAAIGRWPFILEQLGIASAYLTGKHTSCPSCGGKDRFRFDDKEGKGSFFCNNCGSGDGWTLLQRVHRWSFKECIRRVQAVMGGTPSLPLVSKASVLSFSSEKPNLVAQRYIERVWSESVEITESDPAWKYLVKTRGFALNRVPPDLRYHANCTTKLDNDGVHAGPAMLAAVRNVSGELVQVHRTFLTSEGTKAPIPKAKKLMQSPYRGICNGCSVQLFPADKTLGVAEGLETAIAAHLRFGIPVWAALNASLLTEIQLPTSVKQVIIFADNDQQKADSGYIAARRLARKLTLQMKRVRIFEPNVPGSDFADLV